jgi:hypothetical protein
VHEDVAETVLIQLSARAEHLTMAEVMVDGSYAEGVRGKFKGGRA